VRLAALEQSASATRSGTRPTRYARGVRPSAHRAIRAEMITATGMLGAHS